MSGPTLKEKLFNRRGLVVAQRNSDGKTIVLDRRRIAKRKFNAAKTDRLFSDWQVTSRPLNEELRYALDILRNRARDLEQNSEIARRFLQLVETHLVGPEGFHLTVQGLNRSGSDDQNNNARIEASFWNWAKRGTADITGRYSLIDILRISARTAARDGECLIRVHDDLPTSKANPYGFALEMVDPARIDTLRHVDGKDGSRTRLGIVLDRFNRPEGYWIITGSEPNTYPGSHAAELFAARQFIHAYVSDRPEQYRGTPWMTAVMDLIHMLDEYQDSALVASRVGAAKMGFFKTPDGNLSPLANETDDVGTLLDEVVAGHFSALPPGYEFQSFNPDYPHQLYREFTSTILRSIAAGLNVSYHALTGDLNQVSFSSIRSGTIEEREHWMTRQDWMISSILEPIYLRWLDRSLAVSAIPNLPKLNREEFFSRFRLHTWRGRRWPWVDPLRDIEATIMAVNAGLKSPQQAAADLGVDVESVLADIARFNQMAATAGLGLTYGQTVPTSPKPPGADNGSTQA